MDIIKNGNKLDTSIYGKPTNTGLLLHFDSHVDKQHKSYSIELIDYLPTPDPLRRLEIVSPFFKQINIFCF